MLDHGFCNWNVGLLLDDYVLVFVTSSHNVRYHSRQSNHRIHYAIVHNEDEKQRRKKRDVCKIKGMILGQTTRKEEDTRYENKPKYRHSVLVLCFIQAAELSSMEKKEEKYRKISSSFPLSDGNSKICINQ